MIELLGDLPPKEWALSGKYSREFFNNNGKLKHIKSLQYWTLPGVLSSKYKMDDDEAEEIADFFLPMLAWEPRYRCQAAQALKHFWLSSPDKQETSTGSTEEGPSSETAREDTPGVAEQAPPPPPAAEADTTNEPGVQVATAQELDVDEQHAVTTPVMLSDVDAEGSALQPVLCAGLAVIEAAPEVSKAERSESGRPIEEMRDEAKAEQQGCAQLCESAKDADDQENLKLELENSRQEVKELRLALESCQRELEICRQKAEQDVNALKLELEDCRQKAQNSQVLPQSQRSEVEDEDGDDLHQGQDTVDKPKKKGNKKKDKK
jgi:hypothetical protein